MTGRGAEPSGGAQRPGRLMEEAVMTANERKAIRAKVGLLELAKQLG